MMIPSGKHSEDIILPVLNFGLSSDTQCGTLMLQRWPTAPRSQFEPHNPKVKRYLQAKLWCLTGILSSFYQDFTPLQVEDQLYLFIGLLLLNEVRVLEIRHFRV